MKLNLVKSSLIALGLFISNTSFALQERVVAIVDNYMIMESQVIRNLGRQSKTKTNYRKAIETTIDDYLVQKAIKESGVTIDYAKIDQIVENIASQNGLTYGQFLDVLDYQGISLSQYKQQLAHQMMMAQVRQFAVSKSIQVDPQNVRKLAHQMFDKDQARGKIKKTLAKQYRVSHILIKLNPLLNDTQAKQKLENIAAKIRSGKLSFEEAARKHSKDYVSAVDGGDLGWKFPDVFDPRFAKQILSAKIGKISSPFKSKFGWHILKVTEIRKQDATKDAYLKKAYEKLVNKQAQVASQDWIQALRKNVKIEYVDHL